MLPTPGGLAYRLKELQLDVRIWLDCGRLTYGEGNVALEGRFIRRLIGLHFVIVKAA